MGRKWPSDIIYLFVYKIGLRNPPGDESRENSGGAAVPPRFVLRRRWRTAFPLPPHHDSDDQENDCDDRDRSDRREDEDSKRSGWSGQLQVGLHVGRHARVMDDRCTAKEAQSREECESDERVASLADRAKTDAGDDLTVDRCARSVDRAVRHPEEAADARPVAAEVHERTLEPPREQVGAGRVVRG